MTSDMDIDSRRARHARLSSALARLDDDELVALLPEPARPGSGWGQSDMVEVDGHHVFVKSLPVTDLEARHRFSTRNNYRLPTYYSYGVGSAGFGVYRELSAHIKTTDWVLAGEIETFPLMYHHGMLSREPGGRFEGERLDDYVRYWSGSRRIGRYMTDRSEARHVEAIFLEHVPFTTDQWLAEHLGRAEEVVDSLFGTVGLLREHGMVHFDAHFSNVVTDGNAPYLTDFGLLLDPEFELTEAERSFLARHAHYDLGEVVWSIGAQLRWRYQAMTDETRARVARELEIDHAASMHAVAGILVDRVESLPDDFALDAAYVTSVVRHRPAIQYMNEFFRRMLAGTRKDVRYDDEKLRRLLVEAGRL